MNHFEQQSTSISPEKLPSISILPSFPENESALFSDQRTSTNDLYHQQNVVSPPLTPAVSPSSMLMDNLKYQRKYSVDVGPFSFGSGNVMLPHHVLQEEYRRGSSDMTTNHPLHHRLHHSPPPSSLQQQMQLDPPSNDYHFLHPSPIDPFSMVVGNDGSHPFSGGIMQKKANSNSEINSNAAGSISQQQKSRRPSRFIGQPGPNTQHKHVCKYSHCGWSFKRYEHLKRHMLVHTGERPHVCPFQGCGKCFSRSDNFHAHYRTHTKKVMTQQQNSSLTPPTDKPNANKQQKRKQRQQPQQHQQQEQPRSMFMSDYGRMNMNPYEMYDQRPSIYSHQDHHQYMRPYDINSVSNANFATSTTGAFSDPDISDNNNHHHQHHHHHSFDANIDVPQTSHPYNNYSPPADPSFSSTNTSPVTFHAPSQLRRSSSSTSSSKEGSSSSSSSSPGTNLKTHCCPDYQCQRSFKRLEHLKRHMRIHTMERPFACTFPHCNKTFSRSDNLSQHQKTHTRPTSNRKSPRSEFTMHQQEPIWSSMNNADC